MSTQERWEAIKADCRKAASGMAIDYRAPGKGVKFIEPTNSVKRRKRLTRYELTGRVQGMTAIYC